MLSQVEKATTAVHGPKARKRSLAVHSSVRGRFAVYTRNVGPLPKIEGFASATVTQAVMMRGTTLLEFND